jgi:hypothetical protein
MKIAKYGITLSRLKVSDIDFVLQNLQADNNSPIGVPGDELSIEQKEDWYNSITNDNTIYLLVVYKETKVGLIVVKNINWEARTSETFHYYWDSIYKESQIPYLSSLALLEIGFCYLNWNTTFTKINMADVDLKTISLKLGYKPVENNTDPLYSLTSSGFNTTCNSLIKEAATQIEEKTREGFLLLEPIDYESGIAKIIESNFLESGVYLHRRGISGSRMYFR